MLNKLHVPDVVDDYRIRSLKLLMDNLHAVSWPTYHVLIEIEILYKTAATLARLCMYHSLHKVRNSYFEKIRKAITAFYRRRV